MLKKKEEEKVRISQNSIPPCLRCNSGCDVPDEKIIVILWFCQLQSISLIYFQCDLSRFVMNTLFISTVLKQ